MIEQLAKLLGISDKIEKTIDQDLANAKATIVDLTARLESDRQAVIQARADLGTATQTIGSLQTKIAELEAAAITSAAAFTAQTAALAAKTETAVAIRAASITAAQGVPPLAIKPEGDPAAGKSKALDPKLSHRERLIASIETAINPNPS
jgi:chromosome segregation ATPase